jgi:hypothetical protein
MLSTMLCKALYEGSIKALLRLYQGSTKALLNMQIHLGKHVEHDALVVHHLAPL